MRWYSSSMLLRDGGVTAAIEAIAGSGFDGIEIWVDQAVANDEKPDHLRDHVSSSGLGATVHASSYDINLAAANPGIRSESQRQILASVQFAADLEAPLAVVHPGRRSSSRDEPEEFWPVVLRALEPIDELGGQLGVQVAVELMERRPKEIVLTPTDANRIMEHGFRSITITVDLAHSYTNGDPVEFLRSMNFSYIGHIHLSDSKPGKVHVPLGEGEIDLFSLYEAIVELGYDGIVNIEGYEPGRGTDLIVSNKRVIDRLMTGGNSPRHDPG